MGGGRQREREREGGRKEGRRRGERRDSGETLVCVLDLSTDKAMIYGNVKNGTIELIYKINRITVVENKHGYQGIQVGRDKLGDWH